MFKYITIVFLLSFKTLLLFSQNNICQLTGRIKGINEGEMVTMQIRKDFGFTGDGFDSCVVKNGEFKLKGFVPEGPRMFYLLFSQHPQIFVVFYANNETVEIVGNSYQHLPNDGGNIRNLLTIRGSSIDSAALFYLNFYQYCIRSLWNWERYIKKIEDSIGYNQALFSNLIGAQDFFKKMIYVQLSSIVADWPSKQSFVPNFVNSLYGFIGKESFLPSLYNQLDDKTKNSYYGKALKQYCISSIGQNAPDFSCLASDGQQFNLTNYTKQSSLTLIYFWSTNSKWSRKEFLNELNVQYSKYHQKGFNIIGFCTDTDETRWKKLVENDRLPWVNVSDLKGENYGVAKLYSYNPILYPFNLLIDKNGKIMAWGVSGGTLEYHLSTALGD